jgi:fluoride exporter
LQRYLLIAFGGALGSMLRYFVGSTVAERMGSRSPYGTLVVNIAACFVIGVSLEYLGRHAALSPAWRFLVPIGFIGGFSTFSTFEWEIWANLSGGAYVTAVLYLGASVVAGLLAVGAGVAVGRSLP